MKVELKEILSECMREAGSIEELAERLIAAGVAFAPAENAECEIRNAELRVAGEFIEAVDEMMECVCAMTGYSFTYYGRYPEVKRKYYANQFLKRGTDNELH